MKGVQISFNPDYIGIVASTLCLIHCIATPFIFLVKACTVSCCAEAPLWWRLIDYVFLGVSFVAIFYATKSTTKNWMPKALWITWFVLLFTIILDTIGFQFLPANFIYLPALLIVVLHVYNQKYCKCSEDKCCIE